MTLNFVCVNISKTVQNREILTMEDISVLHRLRDINTYLAKKLRRQVTLTTPTWGQFVVTRLILIGPNRTENLAILRSSTPEKFKGCKIVKWIT